MPPTTMIDTLRFDLCANLKPREGVDEQDQVSPWNHLGTNHRLKDVISSVAKVLVLA